MPFFHQIGKFFGGKCARIKKLDMKWIEIALEYCTFTLISSLERKKTIFNVNYEIVLRTPYSKAWWALDPLPFSIAKYLRCLTLQFLPLKPR